jgi:uncharacterized membrane protein YeaQ/YmgE (transglycosylase-associated protein family)
MSTKAFIWWFLLIGSLIGGYVPTLFKASFLSMASLFWSTVGSLIGIWIGYKVGKKINGGI